MEGNYVKFRCGQASTLTSSGSVTSPYCLFIELSSILVEFWLLWEYV